MGEALGSPGWGLLLLEMEGALAEEKSKEERAGSCHLLCDAVEPGTDQLEGEEEKEGRGQGLSEQEIYNQRHRESLGERQ